MQTLSALRYSQEGFSERRVLADELLCFPHVANIFIAAHMAINMLKNGSEQSLFEEHNDEWELHTLVLVYSILLAKNDAKSQVVDCSLTEYQTIEFIEAIFLLLCDFSRKCLQKELSTRRLIKIKSMSDYFYETFDFSANAAYILPSYLANALHDAEKDPLYRDEKLNDIALIFAEIAHLKNSSAVEKEVEHLPPSKIIKKSVLERAAIGDIESQFQLGLQYYLDNNFIDASRWLRVSAEAGHTEAQYYLAQCFINNPNKSCYVSASKWLKLACLEYDERSLETLKKILPDLNFLSSDNKSKSEILEDISEAQFEMGENYYYGLSTVKDEFLAFSWFEQAAHDKHNESMFRLADCYYYGRGIEEDESLAVNWWKKAAEQEHLGSIYQLARCYFIGRGIEEDESLAVNWWKKAAEQEHLESMYWLARCYYNGWGIEEDEVLAVTWWKKAAEQEHLDSMYWLARCYCNGQGIEEDESLAVTWWKKAAEQEHLESMYWLARCYYNGWGIEKDKQLAASWCKRAVDQGHSDSVSWLQGDEQLAVILFQKAAEQEHLDSMYLLARCYYNGSGIEKDESLAVKWWIKASHRGHSRSMNELAECYWHGNGIEQNFNKSIGWLKRASEAGHIEAMYSLAYRYNYANGVALDKPLAFGWWKQAADNGHVKSFNKLAECYFEGSGIEVDKAQAFRWWMKGAEKDDLDSMYQLGMCYYSGWGTEKDGHLAFSWLSKAVNDGHFVAKADLGVCYYYGVGIDKDHDKAIELWQERRYGSRLANFMLGQCYYFGHGKTINQAKGISLIESAAEDELELAINFLAEINSVNNLKLNQFSAETNETSKPSIIESETDRTYSGGQEELMTLIGLDTVKTRVQSLINEVRLRKERSKRGLSIGKDRSYHMVFSGNPGTGKTIVARIVAKILFELGITKENKLVECDRSKLVGEYIGHTAPKTNDIIDQALGGVLFIDEAYSLKGEGNDFGKEAIEALLKRMEDERDNLVVIAAGYTNEMQELMETNPGLESRFTRTIHFDDYSIEELFQIFEKLCTDNGFTLESNSSSLLIERLENLKLMKVNNFANAREVRNLFEEVLQKQETRVCDENSCFSNVDDSYLQTITCDDVRV
ncbi:AAA family ATPase [Pseudomonadota bacterium]